MRISLLTIILVLSIQVFSQKHLFDTLKIDRTTKIIGRYPQYDKLKTYEKYNFIIEDSAEIVEYIKRLKLGKEVENAMENPNFKLTIVKNFDEIGSWTINPTQGSAMTHDGHTYQFDLAQLEQLNKQYPFKYYHDIIVFKTKEEYDKYLAAQKSNPNFLFDYSPQFMYEGSFEIEFSKNSKFPHPKAISDYLTPYIEKIVSKDEYTLRYVLNEKNRNNSNQYTMTIQGPRKLFEELNADNLKNENWAPTVEKAYFFYKK